MTDTPTQAAEGRLMTSEREGETLERAYADEDCGCPVEDWLLHGVSLNIHAEADGSVSAYADTGDWDHVIPLKATTMEAARAEAFAWVEALPPSDGTL